MPLKYTPDRELNPPNDKHEFVDKPETCVDCDCECDDMRYDRDYGNFGIKLIPICPPCQQQRKVEVLEKQLDDERKILHELNLKFGR